jgi:hypothetical protein
MNHNETPVEEVIDPVYRPDAALVPHEEMYKKNGFGKIPGEDALRKAGLPETTPEEKDELEYYKDHH